MFLKKIKKIMDNYGIFLDNLNLKKFHLFFNLILESNKKMNLTSIINVDDVIEKHFLDSLLITKIISKDTAGNLIDIGSGAGFPGVPISIYFSNILVTLNESSYKKAAFLEKISNKLSINNKILRMRAEEAGRLKEYREKFKFCVSRAVAPFSIILELCLPFVKKEGFFVSYKSVNFNNELKLVKLENKLKKLGGEITKIKKIKLFPSEAFRFLIIVKKIKNTPKIYPRNYSIIKSEYIKNLYQ